MKSTKAIRPTGKQEVEISLRSPIRKENLPLPYVYYPNHYGTFFCFSETLNSQLYFCECSKQAIQNHFKLKEFETNSVWTSETIPAPLSSHFFPDRLSRLSLTDTPLERILIFKPKICHRCNLTTTSLRYCHEMYGGNFKQFYGWYINQTAFRIGIRNNFYIEGYTPEEYVNEIKEINQLMDKRNDLSLHNEPFNRDLFLKINELDKKIGKLRRALEKKIENITREEFGFQKIGEGNVSETILTQIVTNIFKDNRILRHYRPDWLEGLELDIYLPGQKIGIEYQGQQHFYPVKAWGGKKALLELQQRDQKKRDICIKQGIKLIEFNFTEPLELNYIKEKINA